MEIHCVKPQVRAHPNKVPTSKDYKKSTNFSMSSKVWVFRSLQLATSNRLEPYSRPKKYVTPNNSLMQKEEKQQSLASPSANQTSKTLHKACANLQWSKRWSIVSPLQRHKLHQLTKDKFLFTRLSIVRILSRATVHKKEDTLLGYYSKYISTGKER